MLLFLLGFSSGNYPIDALKITTTGSGPDGYGFFGMTQLGTSVFFTDDYRCSDGPGHLTHISGKKK